LVKCASELTDALVDHVDLERVVLSVDVVLRWGVHVELDELEVCTGNSCGTVDDDLNGSAQVLELNLLFGNVEDRLLG
jgi:hypothetical protein